MYCKVHFYVHIFASPIKVLYIEVKMKSTFKPQSIMKALALAGVMMLSFTANVSALNSSANDVKTIDGSITGNFFGLIVNTPANVILTQGESAAIKIEGQQNEIKKVDVKLKNGALVISGNNTTPVTIFITVEELNLIEVNGNAKVYAQDMINSDILLLKVNGDGSIRMDVRTLSLGMIVNGSGKIMVSGSTGDSFTRIVGTGRVISQNLDAFHSREEVSRPNSSSNVMTETDGQKVASRITN